MQEQSSRQGMLLGYLGGENHSPALGLYLAALHWLRVPLRGPGPSGSHRQRLRFPAGEVQPCPQLSQPRVLPWKTHLQRGKCGLGAAWGRAAGTLRLLFFLARFPLQGLQLGSSLPFGGFAVDSRGSAVGLGFPRRRWWTLSCFPTSPGPRILHTLLPSWGDAPLPIPLSPQRDTRTCRVWQGCEIPPRLAHHWEFNLSRAGTL